MTAEDSLFETEYVGDDDEFETVFENEKEVAEGGDA